MTVRHMCGQCNAELFEIYDSRTDSGNNAIFSLPDNFKELSKVEQNELKTRHEELKKTLDELTHKKRERILSAVEKGLPVILLLCPQCRKLYDSRKLSTEEGHMTNQVPVRKAKGKIISDDLDSIQEEMESEFEGIWNNEQSVYVYGDHLKDQFYENKPSISESMFYKREKHITDSPLVQRELRRIQEDPNKDITDVKVM